MSKDPKSGPPIRPGRDTRAIGSIEAIGAAYRAKLAAAGVKTNDDLLRRGATARGREELAKATGISNAQILAWVNRIDLMRIDGLGSVYSNLLKEAGVYSTAELAYRVPADLAAVLAEVNAEKNRARRVPGVVTVTGWIAQAQKLLGVGGS